MTRFPLDILNARQTPLYFYDMALLRSTLDAIRRATRADHNYAVHYAVKANANPGILQEIAARGLGADCVSGGEVEAAIAAGFPAAKIVFAGVGKTDAEIELSLRAGIGCFNVESEPELRIISERALLLDTTAHVAIRVNPDVDAHTHHKITTGLRENKFGIDLRMLPEVIDLARTLPGISLEGLHFHIGSQITDMEPFIALCDRIKQILADFSSRGITFRSINVGGGLGIDYAHPDSHPIPDFEGYFGTFRRHLPLPHDTQLHFELGRAVVAQCGSLITRVIYVKKGIEKQFAIVDAGMTDLIRPALYGAHHKIENISTPNNPIETYDVVGPICESSDTFGTDERLPRVSRGDLLAIRSAGAYGEIMASHYNLRALPKSLLHN